MKKKYILLSLLFLIPALVFALTYEWVIDQMEYATDGDAQLAYVSDASSGGIDSDTHLLMHMDGVDDATTFGDSSTDDPKGNASVTATVTTETTSPKFGTAYGKFDGDSGFLNYVDSSDWDVAGGAVTIWTVDFWINPTSVTGDRAWIGQTQSAVNPLYAWYFRSNGTTVNFYVWDNHSLVINLSTGSGVVSTGSWQHILMYRNGNIWSTYIEGVQKAYLDDSSTITFVAPLRMGTALAGQYFAGGMDELRIQQGNPFNLSPNVGKTDTFTPPTVAYNDTLNLQSYSESTIKQQGSYSLKGVAVQTDSLNDTLTKTLTGADKLDLTNAETIEYDIYALRTGSNIKLSIKDSGGTITEHTANVASSNTNQTESWDISGVSDVNKDDIDEVKITIIDADADNTFYIDDIKWGITAVSGGNWTFVQ